MTLPSRVSRMMTATLLLLLAGSEDLSSQNGKPEQGRAVTIVEEKGVAPDDAPAPVVQAVAAANQIAGKPYKRGGGHGELEDDGYDCSGTVSYILVKAGLLEAPLSSGEYLAWGEEGPGKWITVYARAGHVFLVIGGQRFDTTDHLDIGPGWRENSREVENFKPRHPANL